MKPIRVQTMEEMKNEKDESWAFLEKENQKEQKQVNYKQVETKDDDKKAVVDQEAKYLPDIFC